MSALALAALLALAQDAPVVLRLAEGATAETFPALELPAGETGVVLGGLVPSKAWPDLLAAGGWTVCFETSDRPWVLRELGGRKIAFVRDGPSEAVAKARDEAAGDAAVLVVAGGRGRAVETIRAVPGFALALASGRGGADPEPLKIGTTWVVQAPGPGAWTRVELRFEGGALASVTSAFTPPEGRSSTIVDDARRRHGLPASDPVAGLFERVKPEPAPPAAPALEATTRSARWRVLGAAERASYGSRAAPPGRRLLVLDVEVENVIPLTLVQSHEVPTEVRIQPLSDHLYLVVDGARAARLLKDADALPGHVPVRTFAIERLGARVRGNVVFEVPENAAALELRLYDYAHGHFVLPIRGAVAPAPLPPLSSNEVLDAGVFGVRKSAGPDGSERVTVELRARSRLETEADASAFDPKAPPKKKIKVGTVSDWTDAAGHLTLVVDGERAVAPAEAVEDPRFLPDVPTGFAATFLVPAKRTSLELRAEFPNARLPDGRVIRPKPLVFLLEGTPPPAGERAPIVAIDDGPFRVEVSGQAVSPGEKGMSRLVLEITVRNTGGAPETFQVAEQLRYATEAGAQLAPDASTFGGPGAPPKLLKVPPNDRRAFQVGFAIPAGDTRPRLAYRGVTKAEIVALKPLGAPAPAACPSCKAPVEPAEKFCSGCGTRLKR